MPSETAELVLMTGIGLTTTLWEMMNHNMNCHLREIWALEFPCDSLIGVGGLVRTVMTAVALARGLTLHLYLVAYTLLVFPVLFEKGTLLLLVWMLICAVRSVVVNLVAFLTGCFLCSTYSELKQPCFEFVAAKAMEMSCSVYMWLSVSDFNVYLRNKRRRQFLANRMSTKTTQIEETDLSAESSEMSAASFQDFEDEASSEESVMVKAAVEWLMRMAFGIKYETRRMDMDNAKAQKFLNMSPDELRALQNRIKEKLFDGKAKSPLLVDVPSSDRVQKQESNLHPQIVPSTASTGSQTKNPSKTLQARLDATSSTQQAGTSQNPGISNMASDDKPSIPPDSNLDLNKNPVVLLSRPISPSGFKRNSFLKETTSNYVGHASHDEPPSKNVKRVRQKRTQGRGERRYGSKETQRGKIVTDTWSQPS